MNFIRNPLLQNFFCQYNMINKLNKKKYLPNKDFIYIILLIMNYVLFKCIIIIAIIKHKV